MPDPHPTAADPPVEFTDRDLGLIIGSLRGHIDTRRSKLLRVMLREWAATDLREHQAGTAPEPSTKRIQRIQRLEAIAQHCANAAELLESLDEGELFGLTFAMSKSPAAVVPEGGKFDEASGVIKQEPERLRRIAVAVGEASKIWRRGRGHPRNVLGYLILLDLAAMYEWLVGRQASRQVGRENGVETGPFWEFASAVWPVVFGSDDGLRNCLKSWATTRKKYGESSPLIANMYLRHPEWRFIDD